MRKLALFAAAFALSAALYVYWLSPTAALWIAAASLGLSVLAGAFSCRRVKILALGLAMGLTWCGLYQQVWLKDIFAMDGTMQTVTVTAADTPYETAYGSAVACKLGRHTAILYTDEKALTAAAGDTLTGSVNIKAGKDDLYRRSDGILLCLYATEQMSVTKGEMPFPQKLQQRICEKIDRLYTGQTAALVKALLTGKRHEISYETSNELSVCGLSHAVAVSGMHVSILITLVGLLCGYQPKLMSVIGIPVVILFMLMTGASASVCRAAAMQILMLLSPIMRRERDGLTALGAAAIILLAENPWCIASVSFQLSFAAVAGLMLFSDPMQKRMMAWRKHPGKLFHAVVSGISATVGATVLTLPLMMFYFGTVSIVAPVMNLLVLWAVTGVFSLGLASCFFAPFAWPAALLCRYLLSAAKFAASFPFAAAYEQNMPLLVWAVAAYLCLAACLLFRRLPVRWMLCALGVGFAVCVLTSHLQFASRPWRLTVLDVEQGQCLLLRVEDYIAVIDCGGSDPEDAGEQAARALHSAGVTHADALILTHYDEDHSGGAAQFLSRVKTKTVYLPASRQEQAFAEKISSLTEQIHFVKTLVEITVPGGKLTLFPPVSEENDNNAGLCILATAGECDILITGDLNARAERALLAAWELPKVDILVAGHHGAQTSTSWELLRRVRPEKVAISVGEDNPYGHPHPQTLWRISYVGAKIFRTDEMGSIVFTP